MTAQPKPVPEEGAARSPMATPLVVRKINPTARLGPGRPGRPSPVHRAELQLVAEKGVVVDVDVQAQAEPAWLFPVATEHNFFGPTQRGPLGQFDPDTLRKRAAGGGDHRLQLPVEVTGPGDGDVDLERRAG